MKSIFRVEKRERPFVMIDKQSVKDINISWKAKGLLAYLLTLPDDWKFSIVEISSHSKCGRRSTATAMNELIDAGYVSRRMYHEGGHIAGYEYIIHEISERAHTECVSTKRVSTKRAHTKAHTTNKDNTEKDNTDTEHTDVSITSVIEKADASQKNEIDENKHEQETNDQPKQPTQKPKKNKPARKSKPKKINGKILGSDGVTSQESAVCRGIFEKYWGKMYPGKFMWDAKEGQNLRYLVKKVKDQMEVSQIEVDLDNIITNFTAFMEGLYQVDDWYREKHFTPAGLNSQFHKILNQINIKNGNTKGSIKSFIDEIGAFLDSH